MGSECKCINPDGGGTKCPPQHVAICIRGKDKECYGECLSIPGVYYVDSPTFKLWLENSINEVVSNFTIQNYPQKNRNSRLQRLYNTNLFEDGKLMFQIGDIKIFVRVSYVFANDQETLRDLQ